MDKVRYFCTTFKTLHSPLKYKKEKTIERTAYQFKYQLQEHTSCKLVPLGLISTDS